MSGAEDSIGAIHFPLATVEVPLSRVPSDAVVLITGASTGLGLALVSKIVSDHDGWITVDSVPGRTVFRISLPVAPKDQTTGDD